MNNNGKSALIDSILEMEWRMFSSVQNIGGKASCQEDPKTFKIMRLSQFKTWSTPTLQSYFTDLLEAEQTGINLLTEKYARMMKSTMPLEYKKVKDFLRAPSLEVLALIDKIVEVEMEWQEDFSKKYPYISGRSRPIRSCGDSPYTISIETYLRGELVTYSKKTLQLYYEDVKEQRSKKIIRPELVYENQVKYYGYKSLQAAEEALRERMKF